jgi:hypothetical protein
MGKEQKRQQESTCHLDVLGGEQHLPSVQSIREHPAKQRKHDDGQLAQEKIKAQVEGVFGHIVDQPTLGKLLYECADCGGAGPKPHQAEVAVAKRSENAREKWQGCAH